MCMSKMCTAEEPRSDGLKVHNGAEACPLGRTIKAVLSQAQGDDRLVCGLLPAIEILGKGAEDTVLCLLAETRPGDSTAHMQTVLLQAFCYENYIPVIKVDCCEKLAELCGASQQTGCQCAIITRDLTIPWNDENYNPPLTDDEQTLADFYEQTLEQAPAPVVQLPR